MKLRMRLLLIKALYLAIITLLGLLMAWLTSLWAIPLAAAERGYTGAYGGEYLLIGFAFVSSVWAVKAHLRGIEKRRRRRKRCRRKDVGVATEPLKVPSASA